MLLLLFNSGSAAAITGTISATEGADAGSFIGDVIVQGVLSGTEGSDSAAFVGNTIVQGILTGLEGADLPSFAGTILVQGTLAGTEGSDLAEFTGTVAFVDILGTLTATEGADLAEFSGNVVVLGTSLGIEGSDSGAFTGDVIVQGVLGTELTTNGSLTLDPIHASQSTVQNGWQWNRVGGTSTATWGGSSVTLTPDGTNRVNLISGPLTLVVGRVYSFAFDIVENVTSVQVGTGIGTGSGLTGQVYSTNHSVGNHVVSFTATATTMFVGFGRSTGVPSTIDNISVRAPVAEGADVAAFTGSVVVQGILSGVEGADSGSFSGDVLVQGELTGVEGADTAALTGQVLVQGTLSGTEGADSGAFTASTISTGAFSGTEGADSGSFTGNVIVQGLLSGIDGADAGSLTGNVFVQGLFAATEGADSAAFTGIAVQVIGLLSGTEGSDVAAFTGTSGAVVAPAPSPVVVQGQPFQLRPRGRRPTINAIARSRQSDQTTSARFGVTIRCVAKSGQSGQTVDAEGSVSLAVRAFIVQSQTGGVHAWPTIRSFGSGSQTAHDNNLIASLTLDLKAKSGVVVLPVPQYHGGAWFSYRPVSDIDKAA